MAEPSQARTDDELVEREWAELERLANSDSGDAEEDAFNIGKRDGFSEAIQSLDLMTGGDGEYRYCTNHDAERHCPDPATMARCIIARTAEGHDAPNQARERIQSLTATIEQLRTALEEARDWIRHVPEPGTPGATALLITVNAALANLKGSSS